MLWFRFPQNVSKRIKLALSREALSVGEIDNGASVFILVEDMHETDCCLDLLDGCGLACASSVGSEKKCVPPEGRIMSTFIRKTGAERMARQVPQEE